MGILRRLWPLWERCGSPGTVRIGRALPQGEDRQRISLPTYPFERKRYWLESIPGRRPEIPWQACRLRPLQPSKPTTESQINQGTETVNIMSNFVSAGADASPGASRATQIQAALVEMFEELSGIDLSTMDSATTFLGDGLRFSCS